ncbi:citrate/2-methylcitrate synthase [Cumulibacter manganitolerans]|uniref:citrate/2-methylcitrate synthase n=1 Tax=Cumulibacter manganitolerans TaxID=1884992 RepID=UPI0012975985|nr:citrate/2-methylcitrate synthase [Cumulibacter manganitolerans]
MTTTAIEVPRGLKNVIVTDTEVGDVRGDEGRFHYRGYDAVRLAERCSFEQVWFLMAHHRLPEDGSDELATFTAEVGRLRALPPELGPLIAQLADAHANPLHVLRTCLSALGALQPMRATYDLSPEQRAGDLLRIAAVAPTILAAAYRRSQGLEPLAADPSLGHATDYLRMATGEAPNAALARLIEQYLIATVDHGFNNSTFTARVVASSGSDVASCIVAAIGAFLGPLHGGAPDRALQALDEIGDPANTDPWVRRQIAAGAKIMGFGHAVYRTHDPRAELLKRLLAPYDDDLVRRAIATETAIERALAELKPGTALYANVEFYAGVAISLAGLPPRMFTPTFAVARAVGWAANVDEQAAQGKIIRPIARYTGPLH